MKTIILYATKHGAAAEAARRIAAKINGAVIYDLKEGAPSLEGFDCVILGSGVYAGMIRGEAKAFLSQNADALLEKKLGLFLCGLDQGEGKTFFDANFSPMLLQKAKAASLLGGIFDPQKAGFFERLIIKIVTKKTVYTNTIDDNKIEQFAKTMRE